MSRMIKIRNEKTWKARPARRMLLAVVGSLRLLSALPMLAAPAIWTIVATTSLMMKTMRRARGGRGEYCLPTALMRKVRMV